MTRDEIRKSRIGYKFTTNSGWKGEVIEYKNAREVKVRFQCGEERWTYWNNVEKGSMKPRNQPSVYGVGFVGVGRFIPETLSKRLVGEVIPKEVYRTWIQILKRVYWDKENIRNRAYVGVTVAEEWLNFQNFCEWALTQRGYNYKDEDGKAWNIDKDILVEFNSEYNPDACVFVPNVVNSFFSMKEGGKFLLGVEEIKPRRSHFKTGYISRCSNPLTKSSEYLGFYDTQEEAHEVYVKRKNEIARDLAKHYEGVVDDRVIEALNNFDIKRRIYLRDQRRDK